MKIPIDNETLYHLREVTIAANDEQPQINSERSHPSNVIISLFPEKDEDQHTLQTGTISTIYRMERLYPTTDPVNGQVVITTLINTIKEHVKSNGSIKEIRIRGHGSSNVMGDREHASKYNFLIFRLLDALANLENEIGQKITNRIVFDGCDTFSRLSDYLIGRYSEFSKNHNMEIVGTTSKIASNKFLGLDFTSGRYVQFNPSGKIVRDKLDMRFDPVSVFVSDRSWTDFYIDHTVEEGAAIKKAHEVQREARQEKQTRTYKQQRKMEQFGPKY